MSARPVFVGGTASNVGKSWMVTAICAWLRKRGVSVAPFKAQNMSNHSYPCRAGGEIGRAQVAQAEACGVDPEPAMNPILLKPSGNGTSQVVVQGRVWQTLSAREYYERLDELRPKVRDAYDDLARRFDVIVMEGAGSVTELNLRGRDLANLDLASAVGAPWMLVADIERGGVFAAVIGTVRLLTPEEQVLFRGFAVNKFRGDVTLFDEGVRTLEQHTDSRCLGVFPYAPDLHLDAEDSLAVPTRPRNSAPAGASIAIVQLPHLSNATDFRLLTWADWVVTPPARHYDFVVLPGSKNTMADLEWLRNTGLARWIASEHRGGTTIVGICGGYQMMGRDVSDPDRVESTLGRIDGLGLVKSTTELASDKCTRAVTATTRGGVQFGGYEIHHGVTILDSPRPAPFARLSNGADEGVWADRVVGTYLHGALEHPAVCAELFGVAVAEAVSKTESYRRLAAWFDCHARHLDALDLNRF
jgi:adenosylcobyric acid synthase